MVEAYPWWRQALLGKFGPVHENDPQCGYYRMRQGRGGPWLPVAIWREVAGESEITGISDSGKLVCLVDGKERDAYEIWTWVCRYPVPYETYVAVAEQGQAWPEDLPDLKKVRPVSASASFERPSSSDDQAGRASVSKSPEAPTYSPALGHNSDGVSEAEGFLEEIKALAQSCDEWLSEVPEICSQVLADKAANYVERFGNLENRAEEARTIEKKPILDQGRSIDGKWKPVISKASETKVKLKKLIEPYLIAELKRQKELGLDGEPPRAGTMGRRIGLRSRMVLKVISPSDLQTHYKADPRLWADKSISEAITKLAEIDLAANKPIPGATLIEELTAT
ncbi:MAG: hypothetical protein WCO61_02965 [Alphaproteobacteria bacterium]